MTPRFLRRFMLAAAALAVAAPALAQTKCEDPRVLRFSLVPTQDSVRELTYYKPILDMLQKNTGKRIEFYMPTSYSSVVEALLGKWVDVAVLGPESYVIAKSKEPTEHRGLTGWLESRPVVALMTNSVVSILAILCHVLVVIDAWQLEGWMVATATGVLFGLAELY